MKQLKTKMDMKETLTSILAALCLLACLAFSGTNEMVISQPANPKEVKVETLSPDKVRPYILAQHYNGFQVKLVEHLEAGSVLVVLEKY